MLKNIKSVLKNSLIYSIGNISSKIIGLILLPLYAKKLTISEYGILGILEVSSQFLISIFGLALYQAFFRWYWDKNFIDKQKSIFFTTIFFLTGLSLILYLGFSSLSSKVSILLFDTINYSYLFKLMLISSGLQIITQMPSTLLRLQEKPILFTTSNIIKLVISFILTIYLIIFLKRRIEGIYEAQIIGFLVYFIILSKFIWKNIKFRLEVKILKGMLSFSLPLMLASISGTILSIADRYCLKFLCNFSNVGIYSLGFKIANTIKFLVVIPVNLAVTPIIFKMIGKPGNRRFYSKIMTYFTFGVMIFVLGMSFYGKEVIKFLARNKDYWDAYKVIPFISFSILFGMMKDVSLIGINIMKRTKILAIIMFLMSIINIIFNIILIPYLRSFGAAFATLITQFLFFLIVYRFSQKYYRIPYEISKITKMIVTCIILYLITFLINDLSLFVRLTVKTIMIISYPFILYLLKFYEDIELLRIKQGWQKWSKPANLKENIRNIFIKKN